MRCPNCQKSVDESAPDCPSCGFLFAKWRAAQEKASSASAAAVTVSVGAPAQPSPAASGGTGVWLILLALTLGVWRLEKSGNDEPSGSSTARPVEQLASAGPLAADAWRFEGKVVDFLRESPVKGARIQFLDFETGQNYESVTDDEGHYSIDVPIRWKSGFAGHVIHPLYGDRLWPGSALSATRQARLRMGLDAATQEESRPYRGTKKRESVTFDFAVFPANLSDSERQEAGQ